jgi:ATP-dependent Clp protease adaptor protein ClpS
MKMPGNSGSNTGYKNDLELASEKKLEEPKMYKVILHNDHFTTMEFVIEVLVTVFHMPVAQATKVMLDVHKKGTGLCGVYTYDIAVTKVDQVHIMAKAREYPLKCSYEEA